MKNEGAFVHCILASPGADHAPVEALFYKCLDFGGVVALDELGDPGLGEVLGADAEDVGVGAVGAFLGDAVLGGRESCGLGVARVDGGGVKVLEAAGQRGGVELDDAELLGVIDDVEDGGANAGLRIESHESLFLEHVQGAAGVRRIIRNADAGALGKVRKGLVALAGVVGERERDGGGGGGELVAAVLVLLVHIGLVLERVDVQIARDERRVGLHEVVEFDDADLHALFFGDPLDDFHDFGVRACGDADDDGLFGGERGERNAAGNGKNACGGDKGAAFHLECPFRV